jgi:hypothetical protein
MLTTNPLCPVTLSLYFYLTSKNDFEMTRLLSPCFLQPFSVYKTNFLCWLIITVIVLWSEVFLNSRTKIKQIKFFCVCVWFCPFVFWQCFLQKVKNKSPFLMCVVLGFELRVFCMLGTLPLEPCCEVFLKDLFSSSLNNRKL